MLYFLATLFELKQGGRVYSNKLSLKIAPHLQPCRQEINETNQLTFETKKKALKECEKKVTMEKSE